MELYLVRHGIASQKLGGGVVNDAQRPLTEEGREETRLVALGLKRLGLKPDLIVTSPLVRAHQTAEIIAEVFGIGQSLKTCDALAPAGTASDLYKFLASFAQASEVFLVGHEPDMGRLAATLLWAGPELDMPFKKSGVCRIDITDVPPTAPGTLKWFITPRIASLMAKGT
ncbi:MAG TPA: phosphohistidine phosphatase SixA [Candidatus Obscuribacterales bacterium]